MIEWNEMHLQIRDMMRRFVEAEVKPNLVELEHGDLPPYEILRKMIKSFGIADMAKARFARDKDRPPRSDDDKPKKPSEERGMEVAMQMIPTIEPMEKTRHRHDSSLLPASANAVAPPAATGAIGNGSRSTSEVMRKRM